MFCKKNLVGLLTTEGKDGKRQSYFEFYQKSKKTFMQKYLGSVHALGIFGGDAGLGNF